METTTTRIADLPLSNDINNRIAQNKIFKSAIKLDYKGFIKGELIERKLFKIRTLPEWWLNLRFPMTSIVVFLLIFMGFRI